MTEWTKGLPTKPGTYWFYGWGFGKRRDETIQLLLMRSYEDEYYGMSHMAEGSKVLSSQGVGIHTSAELPDVSSVKIDNMLLEIIQEEKL